MSTLSFYGPTDMRFFENSGTTYHDTITAGTLSSSSTMYRIDEGIYGRDTFYGSGLGMTSQNMPTTGTVTEWAYDVSDGMGGFTLYFTIGNFMVDAATFSSYVLNDDIDTLLSTYIMAGTDTVHGSSSDDWLLGYGGDDLIYGEEGNDTLDGGTGGDEMRGGIGDDTYNVDSDLDGITESSAEGIDTVNLRYSSTLGYYVIPDNVENLRNLSGTALALIGNSLSNQMYGASGVADSLYGGAGNDYLNGGTGAGDSMYGGDGNDVFIVDNAGDFVTDAWDDMMSPGSGTDEVRSSVTYSLNASGLGDIENLTLTGTADIDATGNSLSNELTGNAGANTIIGGGGADFMRGGGGNDIYYVDNGGDRAIETSAAGGTDTVRSSASFVLGNYVENLQLTGAAIVNGEGNGLDNRISGNNQVNVLTGASGDDVLRGNGGNDSLYGGVGSDTFDGGSGEDWIEGGAGRDVMSGGADADLFVFRTGDFAGMTVSTSDRILDFSRGQGDQIRLNSIDANTANGGSTNEAFTFIGDSAFHHVAGELRYVQGGGNTYVYGDTNGDGVADFMIRLDGLHDLTGSDFLL